MSPLGVIAAVVAAIAGVAGWALVLQLMDREYGALAWPIGALIGFGASLFGGRGLASGVLCAALTIASVTGGKYLYVSYAADATLAEKIEEQTAREVYDLTKIEAEQFALVESDAQLRAFMIHNLYSGASQPSEVSDADLAAFRAGAGRILTLHLEGEPTYEEWATRTERVIREIWIEDSRFFDGMIHSTSLWDLMFLIVGAVTAARIGSGKEDDERFPVENAERDEM